MTGLMCSVHTVIVQKREAGLEHLQDVLMGVGAMLYMKALGPIDDFVCHFSLLSRSRSQPLKE